MGVYPMLADRTGRFLTADFDKQLPRRGASRSGTGGERIYNVPGRHYCAQIRIDTPKGERRFCSEAEARAGWCRSRR